MIFYFSLLSIPILFSELSEANSVKCSSEQYYVKAHHRREYTRSDGTIVRAASVNEHCKHRSMEYDYLSSRFQNGVPSRWPHQLEKFIPWSEEDKDRVLSEIELLPPSLLSEQLKGLHRARKSKDGANPATSGEGGIVVLYDTSFDGKKLGRVLAHELAHHKFSELSDSEELDYRLGTGTTIDLDTKSGKVSYVPRRTGYVAEDGRTSASEDFANNLEYFLFEPDSLKRETPSAHDWISKKFGSSFKLGRRKK